MTAAEYIRDRFSRFGVALTEADMMEASFLSGLDMESDVAGSVGKADTAIAGLIVSMLASPMSKSVSENGHSKSQSWDIAGIKDYYAALCRRYGLDDEINTDKAKVRFI